METQPNNIGIWEAAALLDQAGAAATKALRIPGVLGFGAHHVSLDWDGLACESRNGILLVAQQLRAALEEGSNLA